MSSLAPFPAPRVPMYINNQMTVEWQVFFRDITNICLLLLDIPVYANNAAAIAGGLVAGNFYRTGADPDPVCVVH